MDATLADPLVGRLLDGRYQVEAQVAMGGMATVYRAMDIRLDRQVALKVMHADLARDEEFVNRFIGEAKSVARLSHPNVVAVFDQGRDGPYLYLAMEYLPGRTLRNLLDERGWFPPREALAIMVPLLSGLAAAHTAGIVHRDVKPENVLVAPDGHLKVVDFGLARALTMSSQTRTGLIIGTVAYLAPEQVTGTGADARTDIYAAGIVLFELLTGTKPHTGDSPLSVAYKHVNEAIPAPSRLVGGISPEVDQLVLQATSRDPRGRPSDAGEFLRSVHDVMRTLGSDWPGQGQGPVAVNDWAGYVSRHGYGQQTYRPAEPTSSRTSSRCPSSRRVPGRTTPRCWRAGGLTTTGRRSSRAGTGGPRSRRPRAAASAGSSCGWRWRPWYWPWPGRVAGGSPRTRPRCPRSRA